MRTIDIKDIVALVAAASSVGVLLTVSIARIVQAYRERREREDLAKFIDEAAKVSSCWRDDCERIDLN